MSQYIINGGRPLIGEVSIRGAKNASFKEMIASMLTDEPVSLLNIPQITDVHLTASIAKFLGSQITAFGEHGFSLTTPKITSSTVPSGTGEKSRTSFIFAAPLLARTGKAIIPTPGGDRLGARPLDRLFDCYQKMNISTVVDDHSISFSTDAIKPTEYTFPKPSHTVTEVVIMTACQALGETILHQAAQEPEIDDLIAMLNSMGAKINRDPKDPGTIVIQGVNRLHQTTHQVIPDRNEAVTFGCAALATKGQINILRIKPHLITVFLETIERMGAKVNRGQDEVAISWQQPLKNANIETGPEPGFMTDWQALFSIVLTQAVGCSQVIERIFPYRFHHIDFLQKMGGKFKFFNPPVTDPNYYHFNQESDKPEFFHGVKIYGPAKLQPQDLTVNDLRTGACITIAALTANGTSTISNVELIERGYEQLASRLKSLGADIEYIKT